MNKTFSLAIGAMLGLSAYAIPTYASVGVSVNVGEPGFFGRIELGDAPRPRVIYAQPVVVERVREVRQPIYLHVPPGYARHWRQHCREYNACGERVYFVNDTWYNDVYVPHYRQVHGRGDDHHGDWHDRDHDGDHDHGDHDDWHDRDHDGDHDHDHDDHGHGDDHGNDHDHDHD